jgi:tryptophan synthase alpha chain
MEASLRALRDGGRKLLVPYLTGGLGPWTEHLRAMADAGADVIEVGIPFSDPAMDGPVIQQASELALRQGTTPGSVLDALRGIDAGVPLVAMTYYNLIFHMGEERFAGEAAAAGISGIVLPDVPMEEQGPWRAAADPAGIETVLMAGPVTPDDRLARVCEQAVEVSAESDGAIVGTAVVRRILDGQTPEQLHDFVASLRTALDAS